MKICEQSFDMKICEQCGKEFPLGRANICGKECAIAFIRSMFASEDDVKRVEELDELEFGSSIMISVPAQVSESVQ